MRCAATTLRIRVRLLDCLKGLERRSRSLSLHEERGEEIE
jgi:hypothetical protein